MNETPQKSEKKQPGFNILHRLQNIIVGPNLEEIRKSFITLDQNLGEQLDQHNIKLQEKIDLLQKENIERFNNLEKDLTSNINQLEIDNSERINNLDGDLSDKIIQLENNITEQLNNSEIEQSAKIEKLEKLLAKTKNNLEDHIKKEVINRKNELKELSDKISDMGTSIPVIQEELYKLVEELESKMIDINYNVSDKIRKQISQIREKTNTELENLRTNKLDMNVMTPLIHELISKYPVILKEFKNQNQK